MTQKERAAEVREILALDSDEVIKRAKGQLVVFDTLDEVYDYPQHAQEAEVQHLNGCLAWCPLS